jgi:RimJ/RimL family protein N-acetyltransferase
MGGSCVMDKLSIYSGEICLVPAAIEDREMVYQWMTESNITSFLFDDDNIPTWEEFLDDYVEFYFDGSAPEKGRGFIINHKSIPVGFINYASFHLTGNRAELDIWMKSEESCGKGIGSSAIKILCDYLSSTLDMNEFIILPSIKNTRAIRAYEKAGFVRVDMNRKIEIFEKYLNKEFLEKEHDYDYIYSNSGNLLLIKTIK